MSPAVSDVSGVAVLVIFSDAYRTSCTADSRLMLEATFIKDWLERDGCFMLSVLDPASLIICVTEVHTFGPPNVSSKNFRDFILD